MAFTCKRTRLLPAERLIACIAQFIVFYVKDAGKEKDTSNDRHIDENPHRFLDESKEPDIPENRLEGNMQVTQICQKFIPRIIAFVNYSILKKLYNFHQSKIHNADSGIFIYCKKIQS
jgi:hypothetical protein